MGDDSDGNDGSGDDDVVMVMMAVMGKTLLAVVVLLRIRWVAVSSVESALQAGSVLPTSGKDPQLGPIFHGSYREGWMDDSGSSCSWPASTLRPSKYP